MGFPVETFTPKRQVRVAWQLDDESKGMLQKYRIKLKSMRTERLIEWIDLKLTFLEHEKLTPPDEIILQRLAATLDYCVTARGLPIQAQLFPSSERKTLNMNDSLPNIGDLKLLLKKEFYHSPHKHWTEVIDEIAESLRQP